VPLDARRPSAPPVRVISSPDTPVPEVQLLSNGRYHVLVTAAGGGYSRWKDIAVTRWQEDPTRDHWGSFCYIRDTATGDILVEHLAADAETARGYEAIFTEGRAEFHRRTASRTALIETRTEIVVSPEDDIELRRIRLINRSGRAPDGGGHELRRSRACGAGGRRAAPRVQQAVRADRDRCGRSEPCCARAGARAHGEQPGWLFHLMAVSGVRDGEMSFETDRARFVGRGRTLAAARTRRPRAALRQRGLGARPDRRHPPGDHPRAGRDGHDRPRDRRGRARETAEHLIDRYQDRHLADRVFDLAWTHNQVVLQQFGISEAEAQEYERLAARCDLRQCVDARRRRHHPEESPRPVGTLGLCDLRRPADRAAADRGPREHRAGPAAAAARAYWRLKGLVVDLVIWTEDQSGYRQQLHDEIMGLIAAGVEANVLDRPGGVFVRHRTTSPWKTACCCSPSRDSSSSTAAAACRSSSSVAVGRGVKAPPALQAVAARASRGARGHRAGPRADLILTNDSAASRRTGANTSSRSRPGADDAGAVGQRARERAVRNGGVREWRRIHVERERARVPADSVAQRSRHGCQRRGVLPARRGDRAVLVAVARPAPGEGAYVSRHGFGYSVFEHDTAGIHSELTVHVATRRPGQVLGAEAPQRFGQTRRLSATGYVEWVLGDLRPKCAMHVTTEIDPKTGALFARNPFNSEFPDRVAFFDVDDSSRTSPAIARSSWPQRVAAAACGDGAHACRARSVPPSIPARRSRSV
jgi:cyclic beta-1,2-glucan synthetase